MACCGKTRTVPLNERHRMQVRYNGGRPISINGPVTGTKYHFSGIDRVQLVDPRDALTLVRSPLFKIEGIKEISIEQQRGSHG
jgi:hypothetical protein